MPRGKATKYIFVTGGVLSGLGKGITAASIGKTLKARGLQVNLQKCDPYLNVDAGTLNPAEHGECFVTHDGAETDLDLGHYERFIDQELNQKSSLMSGRVLMQVIADERAGEYLGQTVQIIPHVTQAIQEEIEMAGNGFDVHIVEIGGTVGDYESLSFLEAIREFQGRVGAENILYVHVVYLPYLGASRELKTKPAQNAVRELRALGIVPDVLVARMEVQPENTGIVHKLSAFCGVPEAGIALLPNADTVYEVPLTLEDSGITDYIVKKLGVRTHKPQYKEWRNLIEVAKDKNKPEVRIGVVAKYMDNEDTYMSVFEALRAAAWKHGVEAKIIWIDAEQLESTAPSQLLKNVDGLVVPGGFGTRGVEGKIKAASYAIKQKIPYLGLCLGLQVSIIAVARDIFGVGASTVELSDDCEHPVIHLMEHQRGITKKGGTMRLGNYECVLKKGSLARKLYGTKSVNERHRHRYEVNNAYRTRLEKAGVDIVGTSPDGNLVELIELKDHPFFIASQFHPELRSRPDRPHPLFDGFIAQLKEKA